LTASTNKVADALRARGVSERVLAGGLAGLVASWERFATELERGYAGGLDEWRNDVDVRDILDEALRAASADERRALRRRARIADARVRKLLVQSGRCLWGAQNAASHGWNPGRQWWYFLEPKTKNAELAREISGLE
jgi:hypothetical protein